jgi:uncharacterized membrane protein SpoIIM required for sporulation
MSPLQFERSYRSDWEKLEELLASLRGSKRRGENGSQRPDGEHLAQLYRRACEHLALARARTYPVHMIQRLEHITADAHQVIYQRSEFGWSRLKSLFARDFPRAVRSHASYVWVATALFVLPTIVMGVLVYARPELILSVVDAETASMFDAMYNNNEAIGRMPNANSNWISFGFYIRNNIGIAFQCFASGIFAGIGSIFFLIYNGVFGGAIAGYLTERGMAETFYSFVVTHGAFELTAIVLSGAAGLRIGHALLAPGRHTRKEALIVAARESIVIIYGVGAMLLIAAAIEAFWSSARWLPIPMKYSVAAVCWVGVITYLCLQGRGKVLSEDGELPHSNKAESHRAN